VLLATSTEFNLWLLARACVGERLSDGRYAAGPGDGFTGYVIGPDDTPARTERDAGSVGLLDPGALWDR
jgi:hypothetical protein